MKKKGFTLVELLAVIAILAILAIIALPNVMELFRDSKKKSFENDVKSIYRTARQQYTLDSVVSGTAKVYSNVTSGGTSCGTALKMEGRIDSMRYVVEFDNAGNVILLNVSDGTYVSKTTKTDYKNKSGSATITNIEVKHIKDASPSTTQVTTCN